MDFIIRWGGFGALVVVFAVLMRARRRPLRVYVAGSSHELSRVHLAMAAVRTFGHVVTHDWTIPIEAVRAMGIEEHDTGPDNARSYAEADLLGIERSDVVWMLAPTTPTVGFWVELGYAIRARQPIVISGPSMRTCRRNVFLFCRGVHVVLREEDDEASAMAWITGRYWQRPRAWW